MSRRLLAAAALALLAVGAGCSALGGGEISQERLSEDADYDWNTTANITVTVEKGTNEYEAVYRIDGQESLELSRHQELSGDQALSISSVYFRYPNGTVVNVSAGAVSRSRSTTTVVLPADEGRLALTVPKSGKRIEVAAVLGPPYEVILPPEAGVKYPLLARVVPRDYERETVDGRVHLGFDEVRGNRIVVRWYLTTDLLLFGGLIAGGAVAAAGGVAYFLLQLRTLKRRREEVAWERDSGP